MAQLLTNTYLVLLEMLWSIQDTQRNSTYQTQQREISAHQGPNKLELRDLRDLQMPLDSHVYAARLYVARVSWGWEGGGICQVVHLNPRVCSEGAYGT